MSVATDTLHKVISTHAVGDSIGNALVRALKAVEIAEETARPICCYCRERIEGDYQTVQKTTWDPTGKQAIAYSRKTYHTPTETHEPDCFVLAMQFGHE